VRRARIRTTHATPEAAAVVAAALEPDNTDSMVTHVDDETVVTTIERDATGGLHSSVDDYLVNLGVADRLGGTDGDGDDRRTDATAEMERNGRTARTDDQTDTTHDTHE
jgi:hypothetical protein